MDESFFFERSFWSLSIDEALLEYPVKKSSRLSSRLYSVSSAILHGRNSTRPSLWKVNAVIPPTAAMYWSCLPMGSPSLFISISQACSASSGEVSYRGQPLQGPAREVGMVFQSFALFPWLTVQQNVELGMEARGVAPAERARRAEEAIRLIGLTGFEGALPRQRPGGLR